MQTSDEYNLLLHRIELLKRDQEEFYPLALDLFKYQYTHNPIYKQYADLIRKSPSGVNNAHEIPFLPIEFFKTHLVKTGEWTEERVFESSGTSQSIPSKHFVRNEKLYLENAKYLFEKHYGSLKNWVILGLLPSYLERENSSLVSMVNHFIKLSEQEHDGFYLNDFEALFNTIVELSKQEKNIILFGVSFALLDFAQKYSISDYGITILETGGMKGRKKEITRKELHEKLKMQFPQAKVHSEYGMTELFSQAYQMNGSDFQSLSPMRVFTTDLNDPLSLVTERPGRIAIMDLANIDTCAFIQTNDLGLIESQNTFKILGRVDATDIRGCNLMYMP